MARTAIILAAGRGSRLDPSGGREDFSKPLIEVGGQTLLERTVDSCRLAGAQRILVVTGYRSDLVAGEARRIDRGDIETVYNPDWTKANGLSLYCCRDRVAEDFALMMSDHIFDPTILGDLMALDAPAGSVTLAIDCQIDRVFDLDDATKVRIENNRIVAISKKLEHYNAVDCGLFWCTTAIFDALHQVVSARGDCQLSEGMAIIGQRGLFLPFDIGNRWWQDVDTPHMLANAVAMLDEAGQTGQSAPAG